MKEAANRKKSFRSPEHAAFYKYFRVPTDAYPRPQPFEPTVETLGYSTFPLSNHLHRLLHVALVVHDHEAETVTKA